MNYFYCLIIGLLLNNVIGGTVVFVGSTDFLGPVQSPLTDGQRNSKSYATLLIREHLRNFTAGTFTVESFGQDLSSSITSYWASQTVSYQHYNNLLPIETIAR